MTKPLSNPAEKQPVTFTPDEEKLLTPLDAAAHDLLRTESARANQIPPCWLVCSDAVRAEYHQKVSDLVTSHMGFLACTVDVPTVIAKSIPKHLVDAWRTAELQAKADRAENNPSAFFTG